MFSSVIARHGWRIPAEAFSEIAALDHPLDQALHLALRAGNQETRLEPWRSLMQAEGRRRLFPMRFGQGDPATVTVGDRFFPLAAAALPALAAREPQSVAALLPFEPLTEEDLAPWPSGEEYRRLMGHLMEDGFLVCLAMAQHWQGHTIQDHVLGVTGLSLWIARQFAKSVPVDLPLLHGAAIGHDVGKFGCVGDETRRIPRLHYHYTHAYYAQRNLPGIGHIATNHSCWDLELNRLPIETQILIYADFRVKDVKDAEGRSRMAVITLKEAFDTILDKLEDVDPDKYARYQRVYRKLRDLEDYALALGVTLDPKGVPRSRRPKPYVPPGLDLVAVLAGRQRPDAVAMASGTQIPATMRLLATAHNIGVMEHLRDLHSMRDLLEEARSFKGWRDLRTYLGIVGDYAPAFSQEQKDLAIDFLWGLLRHKDDDIRYQAACRIADILALGEASWEKDLPEGVMLAEGDWVLRQVGRVLDILDAAPPDDEEDMSATEKLCYAVPVFLRRFFHVADQETRSQVLPFVVGCLMGRVGDHRPLVGLYTCESFELLLDRLDALDLRQLPELAVSWGFHEVLKVRLMAWRLLHGLARKVDQHPELQPDLVYCTELLSRLIRRTSTVAELHLMSQIAGRVGARILAERCDLLREKDRTPIREVMLRNLKARVEWVEKKVNCDYLLSCVRTRQEEGGDREGTFATEMAFHLANILKVSRVEGTRFHAGRCLLELLPILSDTMRNDLAVELLRSLQLEGEAVARYIPRFLGSVLASLPRQELDEIVAELEVDARRSSATLQHLLLQSTCWLVLSLPAQALDRTLRRRLVGILLGALADTRSSTVHEGFAHLVMLVDRLLDVPGDQRLTPILELITKKVLTLINQQEGDRGRFLLVAQTLSALDRALDRATPEATFAARPRTGLLPGTFDPFTSAHGDVVDKALDHADEVWVQVDDYSWRKHAQPRNVRTDLAWMALAPLPEAFLSPLLPPVNLAHPESLKDLGKRVGRRTLAIIVGSDVLEGASAYRQADAPIYDIPHFVSMREGHTSRKWEGMLGRFRAGVRVFRVSQHMKGISSTSLREAFDQREELEPYCDPLVARTLRDRRLYVNYPARKEEIFKSRWELRQVRREKGIPKTLNTLTQLEAIRPVARWSGARSEITLLSARETKEDLAAISWQEAAIAALPLALGDENLAHLTGHRLVGRGALVEALASVPEDASLQHLDYLLSCTMGRWFEAGLLFAIFGLPTHGDPRLWDLLRHHGAGRMTETTPPEGPQWVAIDMTEPLVMVQDLEQLIQPQYTRQPQVAEAIQRLRRAVGAFFAERNPGSALLHVPEMEVKRELAVWAETRVAEGEPDLPMVVLGLGRQFSRDTVENRPTLALDLERFLTWQGYEAGIHPPYGSPDLELQLVTARELGRQAILLVPFLESPEPVLRVAEACRRVKLRLRDVLVGTTHAAAHAALHLEGIHHRVGVVVPHWRGVLRESALVPYIGGWSIQGRRPLEGSLMPSLNDCLPYHAPHPLGLAEDEALDFSRTVLEKSVNLFRAIEETFRTLEGRLMGLMDLRNVVRHPRCPPFPRGVTPPPDSAPSDLISEDLEALARLLPEAHHAHRAGWRRGGV